jgi:hypothetical protein
MFDSGLGQAIVLLVKDAVDPYVIRCGQEGWARFFSLSSNVVHGSAFQR